MSRPTAAAGALALDGSCRGCTCLRMLGRGSACTREADRSTVLHRHDLSLFFFSRAAVLRMRQRLRGWGLGHSSLDVQTSMEWWYPNSYMCISVYGIEMMPSTRVPPLLLYSSSSIAVPSSWPSGRESSVHKARLSRSSCIISDASLCCSSSSTSGSLSASSNA